MSTIIEEKRTVPGEGAATFVSIQMVDEEIRELRQKAVEAFKADRDATLTLKASDVYGLACGYLWYRKGDPLLDPDLSVSCAG